MSPPPTAGNQRPKKKPWRVKGTKYLYSGERCDLLTPSTGCYNCSQRRLNCDRGTPCQKCVKKGLQCSGLGVRYRFIDGVASRGKLAGRSMPVSDAKWDLHYWLGLSGTVNFFSSSSSGASLQSPDRLTVHPMSAKSTSCHNTSSVRDEGHGHKHSPRFRILNNDILSHTSSNSSFDSAPSHGLDHIDPQSRFLLKYCQSFVP